MNDKYDHLFTDPDLEVTRARIEQERRKFDGAILREALRQSRWDAAEIVQEGVLDYWFFEEACRVGRTDILEWMELKKKFILKDTKVDVWTPRKILPFLVDHGVNIDQVSCMAFIGRLFTLFSYAVYRKDMKDCLFYLSIGANPNCPELTGGDKSLCLAVKTCQPEFVKLCLENGCPASDWPALHNVTTDILKLLLQYGANPDVTYSGDTELHRAADSLNLSRAQPLIEAGASLVIQDRYGKTPLQIAESISGSYDPNPVFRYFMVNCSIDPYKCFPPGHPLFSFCTAHGRYIKELFSCPLDSRTEWLPGDGDASFKKVVRLIWVAAQAYKKRYIYQSVGIGMLTPFIAITLTQWLHGAWAQLQLEEADKLFCRSA